MPPTMPDIDSEVASASTVARGKALSLHTDSFDTPEDEVRRLSYETFLREKGEDPDNAHYSAFDNIDAFEAVRGALSEWGHNPVGSAHAISRGGKRYGAFIAFYPQRPNAFGSMGYFRDYMPMVFIRNSYDRSYPFTLHAAAHLHENDIMWVSKADVGRRRHTRNFNEDLYGVVSDMMERLDDLLIEMEHRFEAYSQDYVADVARARDLIFDAYHAGVLPKTAMPDAEEAFMGGLGENGPYRLFRVMQYVLDPRRGKDIFQDRRLCADFEELLDERVNFNREVRFQD